MAPHTDAAPSVDAERRPAALRAEELGPVVAGGAALIVAIFLDGFAHSNLIEEDEDFLTVWHLLIVGGLLATAGMFVRLVLQRRDAPGYAGFRAAIPAGARPVVVGLGLFGLGFAGDGVWHSIFGVETSLDALLSPTHLLMMTAILMVMSAPIRIAWHGTTPRDAGWRALWPVLVAAQLGVAILAFFGMEFFALDRSFMTSGAASYANSVGAFLPEVMQLTAVLNAIFTTLLLVAPVLLLLHRWDLPRGAITGLLATTTLLVGAVDAFENLLMVPVALVAGVVVEAVKERVRPSPANPQGMRIVGAVLPLALLGLAYTTLGITEGLGWVAEIPSGAVVASTLVGLGLGVLAAPPARVLVLDPEAARDGR